MMKRSLNIYLLSTVVVGGMLSACSHDDKALSQQTDGIEILFSSAAVANDLPTRAAADTYNTSLPAQSKIGVFIYDSDGLDVSLTGTLKNGTQYTHATWVYETVGTADEVTKKSAMTIFSHIKNPRYPIDGSNNEKEYVKIFGILPNNESVTPATASYAFQVAKDQTVAANIIASDLLASDVKQYTADDCKSQLELELKHRMAKVQVVFIPKSGSDLTAANMPTNYDVLNVQRTVTITPTTGAIVSSTDAADRTTEGDPMKGLTAEAFFIPPQTVTGGTTLLKFNILPTSNFRGINGCTFAPATTVNFEAGKYYRIEVTVDVDFVTTTGTITTWTNGGKINYTEYTDSII